jgi:hypothetical protein
MNPHNPYFLSYGVIIIRILLFCFLVLHAMPVCPLVPQLLCKPSLIRRRMICGKYSRIRNQEAGKQGSRKQELDDGGSPPSLIIPFKW